jgi:hypothetical protein
MKRGLPLPTHAKRNIKEARKENKGAPVASILNWIRKSDVKNKKPKFGIRNVVV